MASVFSDRLRLRQHSVMISGRRMEIEIPSDSEQVLEAAIDAETRGVRDADPYWGLIWDAAPKTSERILSAGWSEGTRVLELGCGVGLCGIAALFAGCHVTFSDLVPAAVDLALRNAHRNGFPNAAGMVLDWENPASVQFPVIVASDVLYDQNNHRPLLNVLNAMTAPDGLVWIGDAGRHNAPRFIELARDAGWNVALSDVKGRELPAPTHVEFQLLQLNRR
ncbi:MAG: class I SAM-dependent methyltransferase [Planctomyces sp.]